MTLLRPDSTFYPSPRLAMEAPTEKLAYVAALNPPGSSLNDAILVIDVDPASPNYGRRVGQVVLTNAGDELHHFGWNACSSALCPYAPHPHIERRYLVVPGIRSSRIYILDTKPDPRSPTIAKGIELCARGILAPAYGPLRPGRHLRQRLGSSRWRRARRHLFARPLQL
jgi:methanethiol oxidase